STSQKSSNNLSMPVPLWSAFLLLQDQILERALSSFFRRFYPEFRLFILEVASGTGIKKWQ
ncbi:hypothetical protein ACE1BH_18660, partial [Aeromonas jandaei]